VAKQKGGMNLLRMKSIFAKFDVSNEGKLNFFEFEEALKEFGFFMKKIEYQAYFKYFDKC